MTEIASYKGITLERYLFCGDGFCLDYQVFKDLIQTKIVF